MQVRLLIKVANFIVINNFILAQCLNGLNVQTLNQTTCIRQSKLTRQDQI